ncbi:EAL and HDOD domain-containing protein [Thermocrinis minervae]|uniref:EAL and modified HD-GYP domain-containing signal transduction protein n=1 Tax=Thermocrinis minervae TaxID=381751 RepID=A0A1M6RYG1_9AQUI|nr:HDOD domain-containing protein [Thermocrinis minervae]SHK37398.1 EAL and modified HD-GYP domain-containing signal transduction protein [Thermocrinis minervae]
MSFLIAKQPVFDKKGSVVAFEVYLRKKENINEYPKEVPYNRATFIIVELLFEYGFARIGEGKKVIINVALDSIINKTLSSLDYQHLIIDILEPQVFVGDVVYKQTIKVINNMKEQGVLFISSPWVFKEDRYKELANLVDILSMSVKYIDENVLHFSKANNKRVLITMIESEDEYKKAKEIKADFFQGNYLDRPYVIKEFHTAPYLKSTLLKLLAMVHTAQSTKEIAQVIATDVGMSAKILRLVNSAYFSPVSEIKSIEQACAMLGLKNLKNLLLVLSINDYMSIENPELWRKSLIRAIIASELTGMIAPNYYSEAYLMGLFSLIDQILGVDKIDFLKEVKVDHAIIDGFTGKNTLLKNLLYAATLLEEKMYDLKGYELEELERLLGIPVERLIDIARDAENKADYLLKL